MVIKNKKHNTSLAINTLCWVYYSLGPIGGATLGFLSLGLTGMTIGIIGGLFMSLFIKSAFKKLKLSRFN